MPMRKLVFCTFRQSGFHCWDNAPVSYVYLAELHRHVFHVRVSVIIEDSNREVEFIALKAKAVDEFKLMGLPRPEFITDALDYGSYSCEMLAGELWKRLMC